MPHKNHVHISVDIPIDTYLKIQNVHKQYAMNIEESIIELIQHGLLTYPECPLDHTPNAITKKAIANIEAGIGLEEAENIDELFKNRNAWK
jgi:hypothetical protein